MPPLPPAARRMQAQGTAVEAVYLSTLAMGTLFVVLRLYVRVAKTRNFWWDDACIITALFSAIAGAVSITLAVKVGFGVSTFDRLQNPAVQSLDILKWSMSYEVVNVVSLHMTKVSILLFILRIHKTKATRRIIWSTIVTLSIVNLTMLVVICIECIPIQKLWKPSLAGSCFYPGELTKFVYMQTVFGVSADRLCTVYPIVILWNIQIIKTRTKLGICLLMGLGIVATICNIVRTAFINSAYRMTDATIAATLEQNLGIIAACMPCLSKLFRSAVASGGQAHMHNHRFLPKLYLESSNNRRLGGIHERSHGQHLDAAGASRDPAQVSKWTGMHTESFILNVTAVSESTGDEGPVVSPHERMPSGDIVSERWFEVEHTER